MQNSQSEVYNITATKHTSKKSGAKTSTNEKNIKNNNGAHGNSSDGKN